MSADTGQLASSTASGGDGRDGAHLEAATRLEVIAPGYLERVRSASLRLAHRNSAVVDVVLALADVEDAAALDLDAPTLSRLRVGRLVKLAVKRLVGWYLRYLTQQVAAFSAAVARFGAVLIERTDRIEAATAGVASELDSLRRRVERLEEAGSGPAASDGDGDRDQPA